MLALTRDGGCGAVSGSVHCALLAASRHECTQIGPPVGAMELAGVTVKPVGAERLVRTVRRARGVTKKQHGSHATFDEPTRHRAKKKLPKPQALKALEQIDFVEFAGISRHAAVVWCSLREPDQLAALGFDDVTEPVLGLPLECFAPLTFPQFVRR